MRLVVLAAALGLALAPSAAAQAAAAPAPAPAPGEEMALLVDFIEIGRVDRSVPRDIAMVDLLNLSPHVLDVQVGEGSATLQPKERIIARVAAGDQPVTVTTREKGVDPMEGRVHLDGGVRYEMALAYGAVPKIDAQMAHPGIDPALPGSDKIAPAPGEPQKADRPRGEPRRGRGGKVDVGRRRR
jgi:hypothetical protein